MSERDDGKKRGERDVRMKERERQIDREREKASFIERSGTSPLKREILQIKTEK